jgi:gas vesicle protein
MSAPFSHWLRSLAITVPSIAAAAVLAAPASAQNAPPAAANDAAKDAKAEVKDTAKDAKDTAKDAKDEVKDTAKDAKDTAKDNARDARENVRDARETTRDNVRDTRDNARDQARDNVRDPRDPKDPARDQSRDARDPANVRQPNRDDRRDDRQPSRDDRDERSSEGNAGARFSAQSTRGADIGLWFERDTSKGLVIANVATRGAIAKLGFREGDRIVSINGKRAIREDEFISYLFADEARTERIKVIVIRDGREEVVIVEPAVFVEELSYVENDPLEHFGVIVDDRYNDRIVVWRVVPRSPAYYAGIRAGDVIVSVGNQRLANVAAFVTRLTGVDPGELQVQVNRGQATRTLHVDVPQFVGRTERRTSLRPNIDNAVERRDDRLDRREDRIEDRRDRREDAPRLPGVTSPVAPAPGAVAPPAVAPPAVTPLPAPRPSTPAPAPGNPAQRPGLFPRGR